MLATSMQACFNLGMRKDFALSVLGPNPKDLAAAVGVSRSAVQQWPDVLPPRIADRVLAAIARKHLPPELIGASPAAQQAEASNAS
jgi:hypothetical protein